MGSWVGRWGSGSRGRVVGCKLGIGAGEAGIRAGWIEWGRERVGS